MIKDIIQVTIITIGCIAPVIGVLYIYRSTIKGWDTLDRYTKGETLKVFIPLLGVLSFLWAVGCLIVLNT